MATQYPSRKVGWLAVIGSMLCAVLGPLMAIKFGTWNTGFLQYMIEISQAHEIEVLQTGAALSAAERLSGLGIYLIVPRLLILLAFGFVTLSVNRRGEERMESQMRVLHMSESDTLTDLLNRRCFDRDLRLLPERCRERAGCVYIDANGLHELNQTKGHDAGDRLLTCVADALRRQFDPEYIYRIGGDEFVVFVRDLPVDEVRKRMTALRDEVELAGYSISAGYDTAAVPCSMTPLVHAAEAKMFEEKRVYYRDEKHNRRHIS